MFKKFLRKFRQSWNLITETAGVLQTMQTKAKSIKTKLQQKINVGNESKTMPVKSNHSAERIVIDVSLNTIIKITLTVIIILALVKFLAALKSILLIFFVALFLASVLTPGVDFFEKYRIPRWLGVILIYLLGLALLIFLVGSLVPIIIEQISDITSNLSDYVNNLFNGKTVNLPFADQWVPILNNLWSTLDRQQIISSLKTALEQIGSRLGDWAGNALGAIITISAGIMNIVMIAFISFFIVIDKQNLHSFFLSLFPVRYGGYLSEKIHTIQNKIGDWIRGQLLVCFSMGILTFLLFWIIGLKYAVTLSVISAISEFIPYLGPIITFGSAALIAINQGWATFAALIVAYIIIQLIESNILVPVIMSKSVGINPIIIILAMLVGWEFLGILGIILAVPVAKIVSIFVEDYRGKVK